MSQTKFTPITSRLLARKGDAVPSMVTSKASLISRLAERKNSTASQASAAAQPSPQDGKPHRMTLVLSAAEFERLGIAAVKKGVTRHQLVRTALDLHLERLQREYSACACMTGACNCGSL